jgi:pimeloyl-ACP methyl ester carboxylesterase
VARFLTRRRELIGVLAVFFLVCCFPLGARAQIRAAFRTLPVTPPTHQKAQASACPNHGGILDSISVPVNMPLTLAVVIFSPAPKGGAKFRLSSEDPSIVAAGDPRQSFLPEVFIPEGETQSNPFQVFGIKVGATKLDSIPLTPGFIGNSTPTGAWDVNPGADPSSTKFVDANPPSLSCRALNSPDMSTDPKRLSICGQPAQGVAADGVTQLLMRMVSGLGGTACYDITSSGPPDQGTISTAVTATQTVGSLNYGFSFYQAPDGFNATSANRMVRVQFTFTPDIGNGNTSKFTVPLKIVRPPLLLVHGLWASRKGWPSFWTRKPEDSYITYLADYEPTHDASFTTNWPKVQSFIFTTLEMARMAGYAATQADVVAHSMGGILTRFYAASKQYIRPDNFNKGDIHRFITLDTPHGGSSFGNLLVALHSQDPLDLETTVQGLTGGAVVNGAVCDLAENSQGLEPLASPTDLHSYVVTGTGGPTGSFWNGVGFFHLNSFEKALTKTRCVRRILVGRSFVCVDEQPVFNQTTVNDFRFTRPNDAIIAICSQQGGVGGTHCPDSTAGGANSTNYSDLIHFGADIFSFQVVAGVTNTQKVATGVFPLLDGPASKFASSIPGLPANGTGVPVTVAGQGAVADKAAFSGQCTSGSPPPMKGNLLLTARMTHNNSRVSGNLATSADVGDSRVKITTPANGQQFAPGDTVNVTVAITPPLMANDIAVNVTGLGSQPGDTYDSVTSTYQVSFAIPASFAGPMTLTPAITDTSNKIISGVPITIAVRPTAPLSLVLSQSNYLLTAVGATERIDAIGNYPSNVQRDLTSSASGTIYKSSNTKVITVDTEGNVKATGLGTAVVTVTNSGVQAFATFTVEDPTHPLAPRDSSSELDVIRSGFRVDRNTGFFAQIVQFVNSSAVPVLGPLYFTVPDLPAGVTLVGAGATTNISPAGSPYFKIELPDGVTLQPGQSLARTLQFLNPDRTRIAYTPKVFRTLTAP